MSERTDWLGAACCVAVVLAFVAAMLFVGGA